MLTPTRWCPACAPVRDAHRCGRLCGVNGGHLACPWAGGGGWRSGRSVPPLRTTGTKTAFSPTGPDRLRGGHAPGHLSDLLCPDDDKLECESADAPTPADSLVDAEFAKWRDWHGPRRRRAARQGSRAAHFSSAGCTRSWHRMIGCPATASPRELLAAVLDDVLAGRNQRAATRRAQCSTSCAPGRRCGTNLDSNEKAPKALCTPRPTDHLRKRN